MEPEINEKFYKAVRYGRTKDFKLLLIETDEKNPSIQTPTNKEKLTALELAFKYHHYDLTRIISKIIKEDRTLDWNQISTGWVICSGSLRIS